MESIYFNTMLFYTSLFITCLFDISSSQMIKKLDLEEGMLSFFILYTNFKYDIQHRD